MLEIVLCDDNQKLLKTYAAMIERTIKDNALNACIKYMATSASEMEGFISKDSANCFILDIDLNNRLTGYDLAQKIRQKFQKAYIIFLTCHLEYVFQSFKIKAHNFLPKPVTMEILERTINDVYADYVENFNEKPHEVVTVRYSGVSHKVKMSDVVCIERVNSKCLIHTINGQICCNDTLSELHSMLKNDKFVRCHKSFVCNKDCILELRLAKNEILMSDGSVCLLSRDGKKELKING